MEVVARGEERRGERWRALSVCAKPVHLRRTLAIAIVVGTIFTLVNQLGPFVHGHGTWITGLKVALNYVVPFVVSNLGVLAAHRKDRS